MCFLELVFKSSVFFVNGHVREQLAITIAHRLQSNSLVAQNHGVNLSSHIECLPSNRTAESICRVEYSPRFHQGVQSYTLRMRAVMSVIIVVTCVSYTLHENNFSFSGRWAVACFFCVFS